MKLINLILDVYIYIYITCKEIKPSIHAATIYERHLVHDVFGHLIVLS